MDWTGWGQALTGGLIGSIVGWLGAERAGKRATAAAERLAALERVAEARHRRETALRARAAEVTTAIANMLSSFGRGYDIVEARFFPVMAAVTRLRMDMGQESPDFRLWLRDEVGVLHAMSRTRTRADAQDLERRLARLSGVVVGWVWDGLGEWDDARVEEEIETVRDLFEDDPAPL